MKLDIAVLSKPGGLSRNEDACGYWTSDSACCWVLSDGAGGHAGGDVASQDVVRRVIREFTSAQRVTPEAVGALIQSANEGLLHEQTNQPQLRDMRATVAILMLDRLRGVACWGHLGDSRIYGFRGNRVRLQTRDHSVVQRMLDAGFGDVAMLRQHPQRSVLLAALGSDDDMQPAVSQEVEPVVDGDVFMLCSDGLWEYVEEAVMEHLLALSPSAASWLAALEAEVLARAPSGHDNYSAIAVWVGEHADATRILPASSSGH
jgi:serine/threonine protein phosphatase PrpC